MTDNDKIEVFPRKIFGGYLGLIFIINPKKILKDIEKLNFKMPSNDVK